MEVGSAVLEGGCEERPPADRGMFLSQMVLTRRRNGRMTFAMLRASLPIAELIRAAHDALRAWYR